MLWLHGTRHEGIDAATREISGWLLEALQPPRIATLAAALLRRTHAHTSFSEVSQPAAGLTSSLMGVRRLGALQAASETLWITLHCQTRLTGTFAPIPGMKAAAGRVARAVLQAVCVGTPLQLPSGDAVASQLGSDMLVHLTAHR